MVAFAVILCNGGNQHGKPPFAWDKGSFDLPCRMPKPEQPAAGYSKDAFFQQ